MLVFCLVFSFFSFFFVVVDLREARGLGGMVGNIF